MDQWAPIVENMDVTPNTSVYEGSITITGGRARAGATNTARSIYSGEQYLDSYFEIEVATFGAGTLAVGGYLRLNTGTGDAYSVNFDTSGSVFVDNRLVGNIFTGGMTVGGLPGLFRGEVQGDVVRAYWKGVLIATVRDTGVTGPGYCALYMFSSVLANNEVSRFESGPLGPQYHPPNRHGSRGVSVAGMR